MDEKDEIKSKINIVELVQEYVPLKKAGANFKAVCPFHQEKTPSFMVSESKQIWHCFGCGKGGDIFTFLMERDGMEFPEALRVLAKKAGVSLKPRNPKLASVRNKLYEINNLAAKYFHKALLESRSGEIARKYLSKRDFSEDAIKKFLIGYSPDSWDITSGFLKKKGYTELEIFKAGLTVKKDLGGYYDRFRGRLMFPIKNLHGDVIGFGARTLKRDEQKAKYVNTAETEIYNKSWTLYGLHDARGEIRKKEIAVIVEGYTDVISSHMAGVSNVVASSGTALTKGHLELLKRYTDRLALAFDMDVAGDMATRRGIDLALSHGFSVSVVKLPDGKDPADVVAEDVGIWEKCIKNAQPIMKYFFEKAFLKKNLSNAEHKKQIAKELLPIIRNISDDIEQSHYIQKLAEELSVPENILIDAVNKIRGSKDQKRSNVEVVKSAESRGDSVEMRFLGLILKQPSEMEYVLDNFDMDYLFEKELRRLYIFIKNFYNTHGEFSSENLEKEIKRTSNERVELVPFLLLAVEKDFNYSDTEMISKEIKICISHLKRRFLKKRLAELNKEIAQAESVKDVKMVKEISEEFTRLSMELGKMF